MTFIVRIDDPAAPRRPEAVMENAVAFSKAEGNPLSVMLQLHVPAEYDLDDPAGARAFAEAYGERMLEHVLRMKEGEEITVSCTRVQEEDPAPVLAVEPCRCRCGGRPRILHEIGKGYAVQCEECWTSMGTWDLQLSTAVERWNGGME